MDGYRDQMYLLNSQYKDATNFNARVDIYEDALKVTETEPLAVYAFSGRPGSLLTREMRE